MQNQFLFRTFLNSSNLQSLRHLLTILILMWLIWFSSFPKYMLHCSMTNFAWFLLVDALLSSAISIDLCINILYGLVWTGNDKLVHLIFILFMTNPVKNLLNHPTLTITFVIWDVLLLVIAFAMFDGTVCLSEISADIQYKVVLCGH